MPKFRKRPVVIEAIQWTGDNLQQIINFTDGPPDLRTQHAQMKWEQYEDLVAREGLVIFTLEDGPDRRAKHVASIGDWIIRGVKDEVYPCKPDIFTATYEVVEDQTMMDELAHSSMPIDFERRYNLDIKDHTNAG